MKEPCKHHHYEAVSHPAVSSAAIELGIRGAEIRKCVHCGKETPFVMIHEKWLPLFEERGGGGEGILMA